jgi:arylsulfatase A-like enzyme
MAPSRGAKSWTTEGGIRCPYIVRYPPSMQYPGGTISHNFTAVMDVLPTILDLANLSPPGTIFRGRDVAPIRGKSWRPLLLKDNAVTEIYDSGTDIVGWEQLGIAAVRVGKWKGVCIFYRHEVRENGNYLIFPMTEAKFMICLKPTLKKCWR